MKLKQMREYKASRNGLPWQYYTLSKQERAIWDKQEGDQGSGKSTLLAILAGDNMFTDDNIMSKANDSKHLIETTVGKWIVELGELAGMHRATIEDVKAMISRREDSARMAYGRSTEHYPRRMVFAGTTNSKRYLRDETGNRRFWPIITGRIDLAGLAASRDGKPWKYYTLSKQERDIWDKQERKERRGKK